MNSTENASHQLNSDMAQAVLPVTIFIGVEAVFGFVGNILILLVYRYHYETSNFRMFVLFMAMLDLFSCCTTLPGEMYSQMNWYTYEHDWMCRTKSFLNVFTALGSAVILLFLSIDRNRKICYPLRSQIRPNLARKMCICTCIVSLGVATVNGYLWGKQTYILESNGEKFRASSCEKSDRFADTIYPLLYIWVVYVGAMGLMFLVVIVLNTLTAIKLFRQRHTISKFKHSTASAGIGSTVANSFTEAVRCAGLSPQAGSAGATNSPPTSPTKGMANIYVHDSNNEIWTIANAVETVMDTRYSVSAGLESSSSNFATFHLPITELEDETMFEIPSNNHNGVITSSPVNERGTKSYNKSETNDLNESETNDFNESDTDGFNENNTDNVLDTNASRIVDVIPNNSRQNSSEPTDAGQNDIQENVHNIEIVERNHKEVPNGGHIYSIGLNHSGQNDSEDSGHLDIGYSSENNDIKWPKIEKNTEQSNKRRNSEHDTNGNNNDEQYRGHFSGQGDGGKNNDQNNSQPIGENNDQNSDQNKSEITNQQISDKSKGGKNSEQKTSSRTIQRLVAQRSFSSSSFQQRLATIRHKTVIMLILTSVFLITMTIYVVLTCMVAGTKGTLKTLPNSEKVVFFFFWRLYFINTNINPILYGLLDPRFRSGLVQVAKGFLHCRRTK